MTTANASWGQVRQRHIALMRLSCVTLGNILQNLPDDLARQLRDGDDGWSIIEIVCHLRDFDQIFYDRALMMLNLTHPQLPAFDHEAMAIERDYQSQTLDDAYSALTQSRQRFIAFFESLSPEQWERGGIHPERDSFTMTDAVMQVGLHDLDHLEQITRVLAHG